MNTHLPQDAERIAARMNALRGNVDRGMENIAASARRFVDWRFYVRQFPVVIPVAAIAIGYFAIPWKNRAKKVAAPAAVRQSFAPAIDAAVKRSATGGFATAVLRMLAAVATRAAAAYVSRKLENRMERRRTNRPPIDEQL